MKAEEREKIGLIILETLDEYLTEKEIQGDVILEGQFDDITDDLINKLHSVVSKPLPDGDDIWCKASEMSRDNFADWYAKMSILST